MDTIRMSNILDPDQVLSFVGPDLGPNCLQRWSADNNLVCRVKFEKMSIWLSLLNLSRKLFHGLNCDYSSRETTQVLVEFFRAILKKYFVCCHGTDTLKVQPIQDIL